MTSRPKKTDDAKICEAALHLAATKGWHGVTVEAVAKAAKVSPPALKRRFSSPCDVIPLIVGHITQRSLASVPGDVKNPRDALFDAVMSRFDVLQENRKAILAIARDARRDPALARVLAASAIKGMGETLEAVGLNAPPESLRAAGLGAVYAWAFVVWSRDESRDMAKTMAALDKALRLGDRAVRLLTQAPSSEPRSGP